MIKPKPEPDIPYTPFRLGQGQGQIWIDSVSHRVHLY